MKVSTVNKKGNAGQWDPEPGARADSPTDQRGVAVGKARARFSVGRVDDAACVRMVVQY